MDKLIVNEKNIQSRIFTIRGIQLILDRDLAELYGVETRVLKQAVKRNIERFPEDFMIEATDEDINFMVSQSVIPSKQHLGGAKPFMFTEQGVANLSSVLKSPIAIEMNIKIMRAFVSMRRYLSSNSLMFERFERIEQRLTLHDEKFDTIFKTLENKSIKPIQGIFFDGQIFDAYIFVNDLIKSAKSSIILIDNYIDETILTLFSKVPDIKVTICTYNINKQLKLDYEKYKKQYNNITLKILKNSHDRFLIIDENEIYHIGASLKDLGKKWFAFSKMNKESLTILDKLK